MCSSVNVGTSYFYGLTERGNRSIDKTIDIISLQHNKTWLKHLGHTDTRAAVKMTQASSGEK